MSQAGTLKRVRASLPADERFYVDVLLMDPCSYCGGPSEFLDHIQSEKRGGLAVCENVTPVCRSCNSSKNSASLLGYLGWLLAAVERERLAKLVAEMAELNRAWRTL